VAFQTQTLAPFARGDDWTVKFVIKDKNGLPIDVTGYTFWMTLKADPDAQDPGDAQRSITPVDQDAAAGIIYITFSAAMTEQLVPANYYYDLQQIDLSGNVTTLLLGRVRVVRDITLSS
jgi:hypothetical protein